MIGFRVAVVTTAAALVAGACGASGADPVAGSTPVTTPVGTLPIAPPETSNTTIEATTTTELDNGWIPDPDGGTDGPVAYQAGGPNGEEAAVGGVLVLDDGCLYLDTGRARRSAVLWPNGTTWDPATQSVVMVDGTRAPLGARLVGNGGYGDLSTPAAEDPDRGLTALVESCSPAAAVAAIGFCGSSTRPSPMMRTAPSRCPRSPSRGPNSSCPWRDRFHRSMSRSGAVPLGDTTRRRLT